MVRERASVDHFQRQVRGSREERFCKLFGNPQRRIIASGLSEKDAKVKLQRLESKYLQVRRCVYVLPLIYKHFSTVDVLKNEETNKVRQLLIKKNLFEKI